MGRQEDVRAKLARLRREAGAAPAAGASPSESRAEPPDGPPPPPAATPIPRATERLRARLARGRGAAPAAGASDAARTVGPPAGLERRDGPGGSYLARASAAPVGARHGAWRFEEALEVDPDAFALLTGDPALAGVDLSRAVYLDTETTGLEGGAGTYVFLVGLGWFEGGAFVVEQGFLGGPDEEPALLAAVAERVATAPAVVSFFGKVFDRHRLEDKMRVHGVAPPFAGRAHLDLCYPLRRLTKGALPDGRLQTLERALTGLARADDMPGSLAPAAWFDFLAQRAHRLEGVFRHNLDDVRSLATLAAYLGRVTLGERACGAPLEGPAAQRTLALARAHADRREDPRALTLYRALVACEASRAALDEDALARVLAEVPRLERRIERAAKRRPPGAARGGVSG